MRDLCEGFQVCLLGEPAPQAGGRALRPRELGNLQPGAAKHAPQGAHEDLPSSWSGGDYEGPVRIRRSADEGG